MKKKLEIRLPAKAGAWYVLASLVIKLAGMAATPVFTRVMSAEEYGKYALYMSWIAILSVLMTLGLTGSVVYRGMQKFEERRDELISSALGLALLLFGLFAVAFMIWGDWFSAFTGLEGNLSSLLLVQIALDTAVAFYTAKSRYVYGYKRVIAINVISALLSLGLSLLFVFLIEPTASVRIYALLFSTLVFAIPLFLSIIFKGRRLYSRDIWGFLLKFNLPLLPHTVCAAILANVDKVMISGVAGGAALAKYSVAHSLGVGMTFVTGGLGSALQPWIMRKIEAGKEGRVANVTLKITLLVAIGALGILTLAPELLSLLAPKSYEGALISVYPITLAAIVGFVGSVAGVGILHAERTGLLSLAAAVGAAVNVGANFIFLPYSYNGAAFSFLIAGVASAAVSIIAYRRVNRKAILRILPSLAIFAVASFLSFILYELRELFVPRVISLVILLALGALALLNIKRDIVEKR